MVKENNMKSSFSLLYSFMEWWGNSTPTPISKPKKSKKYKKKAKKTKRKKK